MTAETPFPIQHRGLFSPDECAGIVAKINELRDAWTERSEGFHSLGAAAYLDAPEPNSARYYGTAITNSDHYRQQAQQLNPILLDNFGPVYERVAEFLSDRLNAPTQFHAEFALPGFHIFGDRPHFEYQSTHIPHFDRPFVTLKWNTQEEIDFKKTISYTVALKLPKQGGGLRLWNVNYYAVTALPSEKAKELVRARGSVLHTYEVGGCICHTGNELHQILPWKPDPGEQRITFQGHGLFYDKRWNLYW